LGGVFDKKWFFYDHSYRKPYLGEPLIKKQLDIPSNEPNSLNRNPLDEAMPSQSSHEKKTIELEVSEPPMPKFDVG
jgi:hypothetical protein